MFKGKGHEEQLRVSWNTTITNQRLDQLSKMIEKNTKNLIDTEKECKKIIKNIGVSKEIIDDKINKMNEKNNKFEKDIEH